MQQQRQRWLYSLALFAAAAATTYRAAEAFVVIPPSTKLASRTPFVPLATTTTSFRIGSRLFAAADLPEIAKMRVGEIRNELESYGISTKSFLEKSELVQALEKARADGKEPIAETKKASASDTVNGDAPSSDTTTTKTPSGDKASRAERIEQEMEKAKKMSVKELRQELKQRGVRTTSFFEKSEFVRAYAEAIVDGTQAVNGAGNVDQEEAYDPSYRDVTVLKMDAQSQQRLLSGGGVIDVKAVSMR